MVVFSIGAYLRLYIDPTKISWRFLIISMAVSFGLMMTFALGVDTLLRQGKHFNNWFYWGRENTLPVLALSITFFLIFSRVRMPCIVWINAIASTMLGVYLIHDNGFVRSFLWKHLLRVGEHFSQPNFILWSIVVISMVFVVCAALEWLRIVLFQKFFNQLARPLYKYDLAVSMYIKSREHIGKEK